ncbi:MAG: flagellar export protein FliJ [Methylococcales bacterium]|jgi:flagellar protein FliJ|nr:flagellar export protein FliJ [Methylococcales bacterium]MBT7410050.1 flagellar export protein FliJ [Methylococcales bacterium]
MKRSKRLNPIIEIAEKEEQKAAKEMGDAMSQVNACEEQIKQLEEYQQEYINNLNTMGQKSVSVMYLKDYYNFIAQLDNTIKQQYQELENLKQQLEKKREEYIQCHVRTNALSKAKNKFVDQELFAEAKQEQLLSDDMGQRKRGGNL